MRIGSSFRLLNHSLKGRMEQDIFICKDDCQRCREGDQQSQMEFLRVFVNGSCLFCLSSLAKPQRRIVKDSALWIGFVASGGCELAVNGSENKTVRKKAILPNQHDKPLTKSDH